MDVQTPQNRYHRHRHRRYHRHIMQQSPPSPLEPAPAPAPAMNAQATVIVQQSHPPSTDTSTPSSSSSSTQAPSSALTDEQIRIRSIERYLYHVITRVLVDDDALVCVFHYDDRGPYPAFVDEFRMALLKVLAALSLSFYYFRPSTSLAHDAKLCFSQLVPSTYTVMQSNRTQFVYVPPLTPSTTDHAQAPGRPANREVRAEFFNSSSASFRGFSTDRLIVADGCVHLDKLFGQLCFFPMAKTIIFAPTPNPNDAESTWFSALLYTYRCNAIKVVHIRNPAPLTPVH